MSSIESEDKYGLKIPQSFKAFKFLGMNVGPEPHWTNTERPESDPE